MSDPRSTALACDTAALRHLTRVIEAHFPRQSQHDGDADLARRQAFTAAASDLAQRYMRLRLQAQDAENRRKRFEAIAQAAQQLRFAMEGLNLSELHVLERAQRATHQAYVDDLGDPQGYNLDKQHELFDEPWGPRPASRMLGLRSTVSHPHRRPPMLVTEHDELTRGPALGRVLRSSSPARRAQRLGGLL